MSQTLNGADGSSMLPFTSAGSIKGRRMAEFKLHCFAQSGNSYKAALMLALSGADWEAIPVDFFNGQTRDPAWREAVNELGEAPVLEHGGKRLSQSGVILIYLSSHFGKFGA